MYSTLLLEFSGELAIITLNRPDKRNAISPQMIADLQSALDEIEKSHARVGNPHRRRQSILRRHGSGDALRHRPPIAAGKSWKIRAAWPNMFRRIWSFPKPLIAAVNGAASPEAAASPRSAISRSPSPEAKFGYTEVKIGFLPAIVSVFLTRQIGDKRARDLLLTGRIITADGSQGTRPGHRNRRRRTSAWIAPTNSPPTLIAASPSSLTRAKHLLTSAAAAGVDADLERAILENARIRCTPDFKEGLASFLEKRKPHWRGDPD